ncbi:hypothetical protein BASA81_002480 [Batrachochytrium salamandrivorans]|nr:hypothetical protein BASA81_002480 [Batrachochytrium salamandrivorans]
MPSSSSVAAILLGLALAYYTGRLAVADCDLQVASASAELVGPKLKNRRVWITGASSGIGKELSKQVARHGGHLLLMDLADLASLRVKTWEAKSILGGDVDILINNGGISQRAFALDTSFEADQHIFHVDFVSATILTKTLLEGWVCRPGDRAKDPKSIVNISSLSGKVGGPLRTAYCASKFALLGFMDALRTEYGYGSGNHVSITNVCPGSVNTDVSSNAMSGKGTERFGAKDANILQGMQVERCCELVLLGLSNELEEVWMFGARQEQIAAYLAQYAPTLMQYVLRRTADKQRAYAENILSSRTKS